MAIGTTAAIIGAGVLGAGASLLGGSKNAKAIENASDAQAQATREATALQRDVYNKNVGFQAPYLNTGNAAMAQINALLGLQTPAISYQTGGTNALPTPPIPAFDGETEGGWGRFIRNRRQYLQQQQQQQQNPTPTPTPTMPTVTQPTAESAYNQFKNYTGYTNRLQEGQNALNSGYAAGGTLQSGAALQALQEHGQQFASNEFMNYMGLLGGQQALGPGAANALAGVGSNYANAAGQLAINQGNNAANAAIAQANNTNGMIQGVGGALSGVLGGLAGGGLFGGSSYSDERLKKGVKLIRVRADGLPVKSWIYRNDPEQRRYEGYVAQDVAKIYPEAVIENFNGSGFLGVNYAKIPAEQGVAA